MTITTVGWIIVGVATWLAVAVVVGVLVGRMIRRRDGQVTDPFPATDAPRPVRERHDDVPRIGSRGRPPTS